jgi:hypothetical protein
LGRHTAAEDAAYHLHPGTDAQHWFFARLQPRKQIQPFGIGVVLQSSATQNYFAVFFLLSFISLREMLYLELSPGSLQRIGNGIYKLIFG